MGDIFREIDEELRQERFERLWQRYGKVIIGTAVAIVVAVGGFKAFQHYQLKQRETHSAQYASASKFLLEGKSTEAEALFSNLNEDAGSGYAVLSRFQQAAIKADAGDLLGAVKLYDQITRDNGVDKSLRDAAVIFSISRQLDIGEIDRAKLGSRLKPLISEKGPWRHSALELSGLLALQAGDLLGARELFAKISDDPEASNNMRTRASQILAVIGQ
ncbi:MAG: hypothetical protein CMM75_01465 [Rhodospirillaceae bacterium]|nr:hypothetical protein [Rhodospirillaceae bacterium]